MRPYYFYKTQCNFSGQLFVLSCKLGYDSRKFLDMFLNSEIGDYYYSDENYYAWLSANYVMEDLQDHFIFPQGETLPENFMYWFGYLLRFWTSVYDDPIEEIMKMHDIDDWLNSFDGLHVMPWKDVVAYMRVSDKPLVERE